MDIKYDFHIHTGLSACCEDDMTPNNIVNMALMNELDAIAITDHNTCENVAAVMKAAEGKNLIVIPGMEISTSEDIHVVCLFLSIEDAYKIQEYVYSKLPSMKTNENVFGRQLLLNEEDDIIGSLEHLLSFSTDISIDEVVDIVNDLGGIAIPAHIDRPSNSVISNLGMLPDYLILPTLEVSRFVEPSVYKEQYANYNVIQCSDAHELGVIGICNQHIFVKEKTILSIICQLKDNNS